MAETLAPKEPEMHWNAVHEEMWSMVSTSTNMGIAKSVTGTNIQLSCEGGGKMFFHQDRLRKFTNILDFAHTDKLHELADPWGNLTIIMPWVKLDVLQALGQLIYLGNSGNLTDEIMQEILLFIRPEFGGSAEAQSFPENIKTELPDSSEIPDATEFPENTELTHNSDNSENEYLKVPQAENSDSTIDKTSIAAKMDTSSNEEPTTTGASQKPNLSPSEIISEHMKKLVTSDIERYCSKQNMRCILTPGLTIQKMVSDFNARVSTNGEKVARVSEEFYRDILHLQNVKLRSSSSVNMSYILVKKHIESYRPEFPIQTQKVAVKGGFQCSQKVPSYRQITTPGITKKIMLKDFHQKNPSENVTEEFYTSVMDKINVRLKSQDRTSKDRKAQQATDSQLKSIEGFVEKLRPVRINPKSTKRYVTAKNCTIEKLYQHYKIKFIKYNLSPVSFDVFCDVLETNLNIGMMS